MKINIKYILIVVVLVAVVGGVVLVYQYWWLPKEEAGLSETEIPEGVKEKIQGNIQEALEKGEILQSSKSTRAICIESGGGPSEMCDKIPLQGFESFEMYRTFCREVGGVPEMCASFESTCKEFGLTTADKCFRVFFWGIIIKNNEKFDLIN
jgi:hypothetical protein